MKIWYAAVALSLTILISAGCGGSHRATNKNTNAVTSRATITIHWPTTSRYIPVSTTLVRLAIRKQDTGTLDDIQNIEARDDDAPPPAPTTLSKEKTPEGVSFDIVRAGRSQTTITLDNLPVGRAVQFHATAKDSTGTELANSIDRNQRLDSEPTKNSFDLDLESEITNVIVTQVDGRNIFRVGDTATFQIEVRGDKGLIPVDKSEINWIGSPGVEIQPSTDKLSANVAFHRPYTSAKLVQVTVFRGNNQSLAQGSSVDITVNQIEPSSTAGNAIVGGDNPPTGNVEPDVAYHNGFVYVLRQTTDGKMGIFTFSFAGDIFTEDASKRVTSQETTYKRIIGNSTGVLAAQNATGQATRFYDALGAKQSPPQDIPLNPFVNILDLASSAAGTLVLDRAASGTVYRADDNLVSASSALVAGGPDRIAADADGNAYVVNLNQSSVYRLTRGNEYTEFLQIPSEGKVQDIACDENFLYVLVFYPKPDRGVVYLYDLNDNRPARDKTFVGSYSPGTGSDEIEVDFKNAKSLAVGPDRTAYVVIRRGTIVRLRAIKF